MITGNESINTLTIRQYYAALAMQSLMVQAIPDKTNSDDIKYNKMRAIHAVNMADELINELNDRPTK